MKKIVIFGASSAIAAATAKIYATQGAEILLIARNAEKLEAVKNDLIARGAAKVQTIVSTLGETSGHKTLFAEIHLLQPEFDIALIAYGSLGNQQKQQVDFGEIKQELEINFISVVSLLTSLASYFSRKKSGTIAVISSVAGDRGRQSNYIYGAAKGALTITLQGLRNQLFPIGVHVLTIKPGFVDTPMTADVKKNFLFVTPEQIASGIVDAIEKKRDVAYLPWFWRYIMLIIRIIPEFIFKRLKL